MDTSKNVQAQERFGEQVVNGGDIAVIDEIVAPDFLDHDPAPDQGPGADGFKDFWTSFRTAFPDLSVTVDSMVAEDDKVAIAYRAKGTHQGDFMGVAATGKPIDVRGVQITRFSEGLMVERWGSSDQFGILAQVGVAG